MVGVIFVYVDTVYVFYGHSFLCFVGCFSMIIWTPVLSVFMHVLYFCICTCSAQFSMFHMERRSRNTLIIIIIIIIIIVIIIIIISTVCRYGEHYWMVDVDMDCSRTDNSFFEVKAIVGGWEGDIPSSTCSGSGGAAAPFTSSNHIARCGFVNVFHFNRAQCEIKNLS